jgi:tetrapyrrole methylase family protein / MazG family protein
LKNKPDSGKPDAVDLKNFDKEDDAGKLFSLLVSIMGRLRSENGCVWDKEQTHESIKRNLLEETYEAVETIENKDYQGLKEELGDLLLQVVFHSQISSENKNFEINDVIKHIIKKLIRRHPHVFGDKIASDSTEVLSSWEEIKKEERREKRKKEDISMFSDIPNIMPSLHYAFEIQNRASRIGFDWENISEVFEKIKEELRELNTELVKTKSEKISDEIGDILFSVVNLSRHLKIDCEKSLRDTCRKFITRFVYMEKYAEKNMLDFKSLPLSRKDKLWEIAKQAENKKNNEPDL